eukprot:TRINITY_DN25244_c0_g1_i1.p2 TRINITY_DN25244_c0_g1~~TRINITY_DN25244_c0_g1_i1.p2  ORF type:complete len:106 (+),score=7.81 TRINITY_DN25244_c0_g1_i1:25-318(+)
MCIRDRAYALLIFAALEGIEHNETLPQPVADDCKSEPKLPKTLTEAIAAAKESEFIYRFLPDSVRDAYMQNAQNMVRQENENKDKLFNQQFECYQMR